MSVAVWQNSLEAQVEAFSCHLNAIDHLDHQTRTFVVKSTQSRLHELSKRLTTMLQDVERPQGNTQWLHRRSSQADLALHKRGMPKAAFDMDRIASASPVVSHNAHTAAARTSSNRISSNTDLGALQKETVPGTTVQSRPSAVIIPRSGHQPKLQPLQRTTSTTLCRTAQMPDQEEAEVKVEHVDDEEYSNEEAQWRQLELHAFMRDVNEQVVQMQLQLKHEKELREQWTPSKEYVAHPVPLVAVKIPENLGPCVEQSARGVHKVWMEQRIKDGWHCGNVIDPNAKTHPNLVPFEDLDDEGKEPNLVMARDTIKLILAMGMVFEKVGDSRRGSVSDVSIPPILDEVVEIMAFHAHEVWAEEKFKKGYSWAAERNEEKKHHHQLIPYFMLDDSDKQYDRITSQNAIRAILCSGYNIVKPDKMDTAALLDVDRAASYNSQTADHRADLHLAKLVKEAREMERLKKKVGLMRRHQRMTNSTLSDLKQSDRTQAMHPKLPYLAYWNMLILTLVVYSALSTPVTIAFSYDSNAAKWVDITSEIIFLVDVWQNFQIGYIDPNTGQVITDLKQCRTYYLQSWFVPDVVGSIPVETILMLAGAHKSGFASIKIVRMLKIFRLARLLNVRALDTVEERVANPPMMRLVRLFFALVLIIHLTACAFWAAWAEWDSPGPDTANITISGQEDSQRRWQYRSSESFSAQYSTAVYWAMLSMIGSDLLPSNTAQQWLTIAASFMGIGIYSAVIGGFSSALSTLDALKTERKEKESKIRAFLKRYKVRQGLQTQIVDYYDYVWKSGQDTIEQIFDGLPPLLLSQLQIELKDQLVKQAPMFEHCKPTSAVALVRRLRSRLVIPGEIITKRGDVGDCMYFVLTGELFAFVGVADEILVTAEFSAGDHFGEDSFFDDMATRRESIRAETHCSIEVLSYEHLADLVYLYDDIANEVRKFADKHKGSSVDSQELKRFADSARGRRSPRTPRSGKRVPETPQLASSRRLRHSPVVSGSNKILPSTST